MKLNLSNLEKKQLIMWAENTIGNGIIGNNDYVFPEERMTLDRLINSTEENIDISERALRIMMIWCKNAVGNMSNPNLTNEESSLLMKLKQAEDKIIFDNPF